MPLQSLDLTFDPDGDRAMRAGWLALDEIGIRSEGRRSSESHRPHLTTLSSAEMTSALLAHATAEMGRLLPLRLSVGATVVFGNGPYVVAHLVIVPPSLCQAVAGLRDLSGSADLPWIPHLTVARKVRDAQLGPAVAAAALVRPEFVMADQLRHWDPRCRAVTTLAKVGAGRR